MSTEKKYETKPGTGAMFQNKSDNDKAPNMRGTIITPDGKEWEISGWTRTSGKGDKYLSLAVKEPYKKEAAQSATVSSQQPHITTQADDGLPF
jgi:uncharacterized protein (DUF736 family)